MSVATGGGSVGLSHPSISAVPARSSSNQSHNRRKTGRIRLPRRLPSRWAMHRWRVADLFVRGPFRRSAGPVISARCPRSDRLCPVRRQLPDRRAILCLAPFAFFLFRSLILFFVWAEAGKRRPANGRGRTAHLTHTSDVTAIWVIRGWVPLGMCVTSEDWRSCVA